jgi:hypothetical protein
MTVAHQIRMRRPAPKMSRPSQANVASIASESSEISMRRIATRLMLSKNGRTSRYSTSDMTRRPTDKNLSPTGPGAGAAARGICQNVLTGNLHGRDTAAPRRRRISGRTGKRSGRWNRPGPLDNDFYFFRWSFSASPARHETWLFPGICEPCEQRALRTVLFSGPDLVASSLH